VRSVAALRTTACERTVLDRLRAATRDAHDRIEKELNWRHRVASLEGYRTLLARWWGFHAAVEPRFEEVFSRAGQTAFFAPRRKLPLLQRDLHYLGFALHEIDALPVCPWIGPSGGMPGMLGTLYVLEGATLGGQILARHLRRIHGAWLRDGGCRFYAPYEDEASAAGGAGYMWRATCEYILAGSDVRTDDDVVESAANTFAQVHEWLVAG
jgi:heme oxygenase